MEEEKFEPWEDILFFHVCNGGASISIEQDRNGAKITIGTGSYGNCNSTQEITTNNEGLLALKELLEKACQHDFKTNPYYSLAYERSQKTVDKFREINGLDTPATSTGDSEEISIPT